MPPCGLLQQQRSPAAAPTGLPAPGPHAPTQRTGRGAMGPGEAAAAGAALPGLTGLAVNLEVDPAFWGPGLWEALPNLACLMVDDEAEIPPETQVSAIVPCFAAAPRHETSVELQGQGQREELEAALAALPGCKLKLG